MGIVSVTYCAPEGDERVVDTRGLTFFDGQPVEIDAEEHAAFLAKAENNPHFKIGGGDGIPADKPRRGRPPKIEQD